jgi:hypothetical protein
MGDIERERIKITGMSADGLAIESYVRKVVHTVKVQRGKFPGRQAPREFAPEPDHAMMVQPVKEPVSWEVHARPGGIIKSRLGKLRGIFGSVTPEAIKVDVDGNLLI